MPNMVVYPVTINQEYLRQAFASLECMTDLIDRIVNRLFE